MGSSHTRKIPHRNRSPYGWWIASYIQRFEFYGEDTSNPNRRCLAHENTILVQAKQREGAYKKALKLAGTANGLECVNENGRKGVWRFEGLTSLLPMFDPLEDGAEVVWVEHANRTVKKVQAFVKSKHELEAFDDET